MSDHRPSAGDPGVEDAEGRTFDPERTIGGDADLLAEVRSAVEAARRGLAAPPGSTTAQTSDSTSATDDDPVDRTTIGDTPSTAGGVWDTSPTVDVGSAHGGPPTGAAANPGGGSSLPPPPTAFGPPTATNESRPNAVDHTRLMTATGTPGTVPTQVMPAAPGATAAQRWVPPARLKPAVTPVPAAFIDEPPPKRGRTWWVLGAAAVVVAAGVGIAVAVTRGESTPSDDSTVTVPNTGDSTPVTSAADVTVAPTSARPTTVAPTTTAAPTTVAPTTVAPSTAAPVTLAPPETVAPEPPPETAPPAAGG